MGKKPTLPNKHTKSHSGTVRMRNARFPYHQQMLHLSTVLTGGKMAVRLVFKQLTIVAMRHNPPRMMQT